MSVFHAETVRCACGAALTVPVADSVNGGSRPQLREQILAGTLHRTTCGACGRRLAVETSFYYSDFSRNLLIRVLPAGERDGQARAARELEEAAALVPDTVWDRRARTTAVVVGIGALRQALVAQDGGLAAAPGSSPQARPPFWARLWPWKRTPAAMARLRAYAAQVAAGRWPNVAAPAFAEMLAGLPRGAQLPPAAKRNLRLLLSYAKAKGYQKLQDDLFEIRFGFALDDEWSRNDDPDDIESLWNTLDALPDGHVAGNPWIREIDLDPDGDGKLAGSYRASSREISIASTELARPGGLQAVIRHEIGHAVHASQETVVSDWLTARFGWRTFTLDDSGIDEWVLLTGGWGGLWEDDRRAVRAVLRAALGPGSCWGPGRLPDLGPEHPWQRAGFGPRLAFEQTGPDWYQRFATWHRAGGKALFLNYWYAGPMAVDVATLDIVARMPRSFAAMSPREFFAELYALYYDPGDRRREDLPADVARWMATHIGRAG